MRVLLTAPYVGEIGWELMSWQGRVRRLYERGGYDHLVVLGSAGKSAFYDDMPLDYEPVDLSILPGSAYEDRRALAPDYEIVSAECIREPLESCVRSAAQKWRESGHEVEILWPDYAGTIYPCDDESQRFVRFAQPASDISLSPWVVMVQRTRGVGADNWSPSQWESLRDGLENRGIHTSLYPCESSGAIAAASQCDLAVGQSTGGLHLASLCGCPHVVWSVDDGHYWTPWEMTNRQRYETLWNPLATPVDYHACDGLPEVDEVIAWIESALARIGRRTGSDRARAVFQRTWQRKQWLLRNVIRQSSFKRWPWRVQRFVRYQMV